MAKNFMVDTHFKKKRPNFFAILKIFNTKEMVTKVKSKIDVDIQILINSTLFFLCNIIYIFLFLLIKH
jgi:hypothetical protein